MVTTAHQNASGILLHSYNNARVIESKKNNLGQLSWNDLPDDVASAVRHQLKKSFDEIISLTISWTGLNSILS